jgi:hypothetical protein
VTPGRRRALLSGLAVAAVYAALAAWSGHLSPLARRPLLDGLVPPVPYRWVEPPPELATTNVAPARQRFEVSLGEAGSETAVLTTDDAQLTIILAEGSFLPEPDQRSVEIRVEPLGASAVTPPEPPTQIRGNVYRVEATYLPSDEPAPLATEARVVLVYPLLAGDHGGHEVLVSRRGRAWTAVETNDLASIQQADGPVETLGYLTVGGQPLTPGASPSPGSDGGGDSGVPVATFVITAALVVLGLGVVAALWPGRANRPAAGEGTGSRRGSSRSGSRSSRRG